jgi:hypothetical protein
MVEREMARIHECVTIDLDWGRPDAGTGLGRRRTNV